ncbi:MAG TPA: multicopper oxidase domain-containing protein [Gemmatimonadaceae bacterium]|nr:multicopper oxidase domain-containing protein [Gemmatimonadaceae bacterium]
MSQSTTAHPEAHNDPARDGAHEAGAIPASGAADDSDGALNASLATPDTRRTFLKRASLLTLAIPGIGAALTACESEQHGGGAGSTQAARDTSGTRRGPRTDNPDSRLDTALHREEHPVTTHFPATAAEARYERFDPALPPLSRERTLDIHFRAVEAPVRVSSDLVVAGWTFEGNIPGPIIHCRVGDTVNFTLTNEAVVPHSMDFHAAQIDPKVAFRSVGKGQSVSYSFRPRYAGAFCYHCGTAPVLMHIGSGMYGAIIVSPRDPLPPAREFVLVQGEYYLADAVNGVRPSDYRKMLAELPDVVTFNGRPDQYSREPIRVRKGERVRFWVVNAGPSLECAFHIVGEQFDVVYLGEPPENRIRGVQTWSVPAGGGMGFELTCDVPGEFAFVNHAFGHGQKGAIGRLVVEETGEDD